MRLVDGILHVGALDISESEPDGTRGPGTQEPDTAVAVWQAPEIGLGVPMLFVQTRNSLLDAITQLQAG